MASRSVRPNSADACSARLSGLARVRARIECAGHGRCPGEADANSRRQCGRLRFVQRGHVGRPVMRARLSTNGSAGVVRHCQRLARSACPPRDDAGAQPQTATFGGRRRTPRDPMMVRASHCGCSHVRRSGTVSSWVPAMSVARGMESTCGLVRRGEHGAGFVPASRWDERSGLFDLSDLAAF